MTIRYSMQANASATPFADNQYLHGRQSKFSLVTYGKHSEELYFQLSRYFKVTKHSTDLDGSGFDAGFIDCRGSEIAFTGQNNGSHPRVAFALVDEHSYFPTNPDLSSAAIQLISESEISNGVLKLRIESCKHRQSQANTKSAACKTNNHKIRQPLHAIGLFAKSLEQEVSNPEQKATLAKILNSCTELNHLLDDTFTKPKFDADATLLSKDACIRSVGTCSHVSEAVASVQPYKILLVDDDPVVLEATHLMLAGMNCDTYPASNIPEALEILEELDELPDMLVVDYDLGDGTNGEMAIKKICSAAKQQLPAIVVTGSIDQIDQAQSNDGVFQVLTKPADPTLLLKTISHAVDHGSNAPIATHQ